MRQSCLTGKGLEGNCGLNLARTDQSMVCNGNPKKLRKTQKLFWSCLEGEGSEVVVVCIFHVGFARQKNFNKNAWQPVNLFLKKGNRVIGEGIKQRHSMRKHGHKANCDGAAKAAPKNNEKPPNKKCVSLVQKETARKQLWFASSSAKAAQKNNEKLKKNCVSLVQQETARRQLWFASSSAKATHIISEKLKKNALVLFRKRRLGNSCGLHVFF